MDSGSDSSKTASCAHLQVLKCLHAWLFAPVCCLAKSAGLSSQRKLCPVMLSTSRQQRMLADAALPG